jgi:CubicO group peptidase (beta-lactamase class C family)
MGRVAIPYGVRRHRADLAAKIFTPLAAIGCGVVVFLLLLDHSISHYFTTRPTSGSPEAAFKQELDRTAPGILRHFGVPGVVVATVVDGAPSQTYAYGLADVRTRAPMTADTVFRVASISKSLTAWGVLRLAQEGKIDLNQPVERYMAHWPLPPSVFPSKAVTVRGLLSHTAGISAGDDSFRRPDEPRESALDLLRGEPSRPGPRTPAATLVAPAGRRFIYSAHGYTLLQMVIEDQTHLSFDDYMKRAVLRPLGMTSSSFAWDPALRARTATGYLSDGRPSPALISQDAAADSLFATAADLARFIAAPMPDKALPAGAGVLNAGSVDYLFDDDGQVRSLQLSSLGADHPALGYFVEHFPGRPSIVTNGGYDPGWSSRFYLAPATGDGLVILTNSDLGQPVIAQIASIWSSWRGLPPSGMTSTYRVFGVYAAALISLLVMLTVSFALGLAFEIASGVRRPGAFNLTSIANGALECVLSISAILLWTIAHRALRTMPTLNAYGLSAIGCLTVIVLARLLAPVDKAGISAQASRAGPAGGRHDGIQIAT